MNTTVPEYSIVIPARYASTRFPGKPLVSIAGRPLLLHVVDRARESGAADCHVATDDSRIEALCRAHGVSVVLTSPDHPSGTDRLAEVATRLGWDDARLVVGLQGDEPATPPAVLDALAVALDESAAAEMATVATPFSSVAEYRNPNRVKVVCGSDGRALYFSRAPIPFRRDGQGDEPPESALLHVGLYAYRAGFLKRYASLAPSPLEAVEQLEQLRVLHHGFGIRVLSVASMAVHGVDHPDDVPAVEAALRSFVGAGSAPAPTSARVVLVTDRPFFRRVVASHLRRLRPAVTFETLAGPDDLNLRTPLAGGGDPHAALCLYDFSSVFKVGVAIDRRARELVTLAERSLGARVGFVVDEQDDDITETLLTAGASGVLVKAVPPAVLSNALVALVHGEVVRPAPVVNFSPDALPVELRQQLSARRQKLLRLLLGGLSLSKIAERLEMTQDKVVTESREVMSIVRGRG